MLNDFDILFDDNFVPETKWRVVKKSDWSHIYSGDNELWADGFYHPIYVPYCKVEIYKEEPCFPELETDFQF